MGAQPYWYFTEYDLDVDAALQSLRRREFDAGRYNPVLRFIKFPIDSASPSPRAQHSSIEQAREAAGADGTRSILDIESVGEIPDFGTAAPIDQTTLVDLYDTTQPTREMLESDPALFDHVERGEARYVIVYQDGQPNELLFLGYSYD